MAKKQDIADGIGEAEALDIEGDVRVYELGFHLDAELPSEEVKSAYRGVRDVISANSGTIVAEGEPVMIQLAYTISRQETSGRRDFNSAYFCWIAYEATALQHDEILAAARAHKYIVRFIDLVTTKDAARHAVELREFAMKAPEPVNDPEAAADVELEAALQNVGV